MKTINYEIDQTHPKGWLQRVMAPAQAACSWIIEAPRVSRRPVGLSQTVAA